jgi:hypothetical protein
LKNIFEYCRNRNKKVFIERFQGIFLNINV